MKCPKCGYLGFEDADRCRNCGYDFSLSAPVAGPELPLRLDSQGGKPFEDLALVEEPAVGERPAVANPSPDSNRRISEPPAAASRASDGELSLFGSDFPDEDDEPLITRASAPRAPLAVRRSTPEVPRLRADQPRAQSFDLAPDEFAAVQPRSQMPSPPRRHAAGDVSRDPGSVEAAGILARLVAATIDLLILGAVDAIVVYFTLRICGLTVQDLAILPKGPLIAFLLVQNGGYLVAFTAGGQTLGKMAAGIRVIAAEPASTLDVGHAFVREMMWLVLVAPAGLGFLPALFNRDRRGLHDRLAGTRVVR